MMIKTKLFNGYFKNNGEKYVFVNVDEEINCFLDESRVEYVDVKMRAVLIDGEIFNSALLIYKIN